MDKKNSRYGIQWTWLALGVSVSAGFHLPLAYIILRIAML